jgi:ubiquinol-cytochrome c reductase cytochrome c1 subunit
MKGTISMRRAIIAALAAFAAVAGATSVQAAGETKHPRPVEGSWEGAFGRFDRAQLQRGFQVYKEVCSSCHAMNLLHYRNLGDPGGPFHDPKYPNPNDNPVVKAIAASYTVKDVDADGAEVERPGLPKDRFVKPFETKAIAMQANGGAYPPDLSVITKARHSGPDYVYSLLTGYDLPLPKDENGKEKAIPEGKHYNPYMPGGVIAMGRPIQDEQVVYADTEANKGIKPTTDQISRDVAAFLTWAGEPHQTLRKTTGFGVMAFLFIFAILLWFSYRSIWRNVEH